MNCHPITIKMVETEDTIQAVLHCPAKPEMDMLLAELLVELASNQDIMNYFVEFANKTGRIVAEKINEIQHGKLN